MALKRIVPKDWAAPVAVFVGATLETAKHPIALFQHQFQAEKWAGRKGMYPGRYKIVELGRKRKAAK